MGELNGKKEESSFIFFTMYEISMVTHLAYLLIEFKETYFEKYFNLFSYANFWFEMDFWLNNSTWTRIFGLEYADQPLGLI